MAQRILVQIASAVSDLNPIVVRDAAERPLSIRLVASHGAGYAAMEGFLSPPGASGNRRLEQVRALFRNDDPSAPGECDLEIYEEGLPRPESGFSFSRENPMRTVHEILARREELGLSLSRYFLPFRKLVVGRIITSISKENALFALVAAVPDLAPGVLKLPSALSEVGSDTPFLTVNQIRMAFLLCAASDRPAGYREQRAEIASIIAGAFGWRSLARELAGKVPFAGGLIPKASIAFAGTFVVGSSLERFYRMGYGYTRAERRLAYEGAFERGKQIVTSATNIWRGWQKA